MKIKVQCPDGTSHVSNERLDTVPSPAIELEEMLTLPFPVTAEQAKALNSYAKSLYARGYDLGRAAERARIVAWLNDESFDEEYRFAETQLISTLLAAIERGEHLKP